MQLPLSSGVYWFKDSIGSILYVGKAKNLKRRLASYHRAHDPKTVTLVKHIHTINFLITDSELDALLLEAAYIKAFQPPYNISLKDDKSPIYIAITQETYPKVLILRKPQLHGRYFGPFPSTSQTKILVHSLRKIFPFCNSTGKPCFYYHLGLCPGACLGKISPPDYRLNISRLSRFLSGKTHQVIHSLELQMTRLSKQQHYEAAARIRDQLQHLYYLHRRPLSSPHPNAASQLYQLLLPIFPELNNLNRIEGYDISNLSGLKATGSMVVFTHGEPDTSQYRRFKINTQLTPHDPAMMTEVLRRRLRHSDWPTPDLILLDGGLPQLSVGLKLTPIPLVTLAKREETIFTSQGPIKLPRTSPVLHLLQHLRDEAHRFARSYHLKLRDKIN